MEGMENSLQLNDGEATRKKAINWKRGLFLTCLLVLSVSHFLIFWAYMNFETIRLTFFKYDMYGELKFVGFERYVKIFKEFFIYEGNEPNLNMFFNTFRAILINVIIFPLALYTAYSFYKKVYGEKFFRVIFYMPSIISLVALTMAYRSMFDGNIGGPVAEVFSWFDINTNKWLDVGLPENTQMWTLIYIFSILMGLGTNVILMSGAMLRIPQDIPEALEIDGCGYFREMFSVTIPLIMPTITTWSIAIFTSVFGFMMQPMLIAISGGYQNKMMTIPWFLFNMVQSQNKEHLLYAATLGIMFSVFMLPFTLGIRLLLERVTPDVDF
ncbi:MAG: sugar ABC transporter permease [Clostridiales bacterium]|nr:sugar ABC transporter permease [Clostridiales bacterium]